MRTLMSPDAPKVDRYQLIAEIAVAAGQAMIKHLTENRNLQGAVTAAQACLIAMEAATEQFAQMSPKANIACKEGCSACCHAMVRVRPIFAILAAAHCRSTMTDEQFGEVARRFGSRLVPCGFLVDNRCSIYEVRPPVCRGYYSFDLDLCLIGNSCEREKAPEDLPPEHFNRLIYFQSCEMNVAFEMAERQLGLDTDVVHLNLAMRVLFAQPDAIERWLKGEKVFSNPPTELRGMTLSRS